LDAGYVNTASVRPDGKVLAIGGFHGHITEWDLTTRQPLDASADPPEPVTDLRFSPDGTKVRGWAGGWYEWDTKTAKQTRLTPRLNAGASERVAVSDDQKWLAKVVGSGLGPQTVELIDLGTGKRRHTISGIGYRDRVRFLPDGRLSVLSPSGLRLFDPATGKPAGQVPAAESGDVAVSPDGRVAAVVARTDDGARVTRWDLAAGRNTAEWTGTVTHKGAVQFLIADLSADRRLLIQFTFAENQIVRRTRVGVFDLATGRRMSEWEPPLDVFTPVFSPDGRAVACLSAHAFGIEMRETATGGRRVPGSFAGFARACAFSPDGRTLAASGRLGPVELWDLAGRPAPRWADQSPADVWTGLASPDAERAFDAMAVLRAHPPEAVRLLTDRMKVLAPPDPDWTAARLNDLDATNFRRREQATKDLAAAGEAVLRALRGAQATASAEAPSSHKLRAIRACEVLEGIGTPEARALLADWAKGAPGATLTREATESLERLKSR
ncbi:MAG TPA: hypothetical protein VKD90_13235, partial [Gemmataceae bacterium]|nr:hypothetical protein [Gemmataceae bacterium]